MSTSRPFRIVLPALLVASALPAQATRIADEGSFTIMVAGRTVGRENFRITAVPRGESVVYLAKAEVAFGDRKISPELHTDGNGTAIDYKVTRSGDDTEVWDGAISRGRLSTRITTERGPAAREFIVPAGAMILDDDLQHQLYFIVRRTKSGRVPVIIPHRNTQATFTVATVGNEPLQVGTEEVTATHVTVLEPGGERRDVWVDAAGRVLRVEDSARRMVAMRDDPPRS